MDSAALERWPGPASAASPARRLRSAGRASLSTLSPDPDPSSVRAAHGREGGERRREDFDLHRIPRRGRVSEPEFRVSKSGHRDADGLQSTEAESRRKMKRRCNPSRACVREGGAAPGLGWPPPSPHAVEGPGEHITSTAALGVMSPKKQKQVTNARKDRKGKHAPDEAKAAVGT